MTTPVVILDAGNSIIKGRTATREREFVHALAQITESNIDKVTAHNRGTIPPGYIRVNGQPYAYGEAAERKDVLKRKTGAARYVREYFGVLVGVMLAQLYPDRGETVALFASHAPQDINYADDLIKSALGYYAIEIEDRSLTFNVECGVTYDEPIGGLMNVILAADGHHYERSDVYEGRALVIDIGGYTTDLVAVNPGGEVDFSIHESIPLGIQEILRDFENSIKNTYRADFKGARINPEQLRAAITTGAFHGGGRVLDCRDEAAEATTKLLNGIASIYQSVAGGPLQWNNIILTGGGSAMLADRLISEVLDHSSVLLADKEVARMHLANIRGGLKLWRLLDPLGEGRL